MCVADTAGPCPRSEGVKMEEALIAIVAEVVGVALVALIACAVRRLWPSVQTAPTPVLRLAPAAGRRL